MKYLFLAIVASFFPMFVFAHPGNTDYAGCHTCYTNCSSWGLSYGEYHCHNPKSYAPSYPAPSYSAPSCPSMSSYDSLSGSCKCYSGYVVGTDFSGKQACVSADSKCTDLLGYGAEYDSSSQKCDCRYGYVFNGSKCESETTYCNNLLGLMSRYNSSTKKCECWYGYTFDGVSCKYKTNTGVGSYNYNYLPDTSNSYCPTNSSLNSDGKCYCYDGYKVNNSKDGCEKISCPINSSLTGNNCVCTSGYIMKNQNCITNTEDCKLTFGNNAYGVQKDTSSSTCYCLDGYEWNSNKTECVIKVVVQAPSATIENVENNNPGVIDKYLFSKPIKFGNRGVEVTKLQELLVEKKYLKTKTYGYFGVATRTSLKKFQKDNKLKQSGWLDKLTIELLNNQ